MRKVKNRWLIATSAVGIHISIGSVYAWSNFTNPLIQQFGWTTSQVQLTFSLAILFLGLSAAFMGHFVEKHGPRKAGLVAAIFFGVGTFGSGFAVNMESLSLLYLCYGVLGGIGLGVGYIAPVSTLVKWFPDRRGLATGLAIMGFGFAAAISSPIMNSFIQTMGVANTFYILGAAYFLVMTVSSLYLERPPENWMPAGFEQKVKASKSRYTDLSQLTANEAIKTSRFYYLWIMLFINITCGIAILSAAKPLAQESIGLTAAEAATLVGILGLFNGLGRIGWASISDYIGRPNTYTTFFVLQIILFALLPHTTGALMFQIMLAVIYTCYGGGFAAIPAFIGDLFGTKQLGAIHGYILTAWAAAGLAGPMFAAWMKDTTGSYASSLTFFVGLFVVAFIVSLLIRKDIRRLREQAGLIQERQAS
ncbi:MULTISPECIES: OFA family MFS transporter [unclassified Paenibacillus]|uniref:L-lactate MFS transporter n=1 Tax=unclassified Paenibacillus TaxID=185978 RepID=UPI001AE21BB9|nr:MULTISPECIES: OFA family MFS transporter [unclassified Paenibacillus]MBP1156446.1 OFA family oxalate/formate antiporter-like MFS transporter [Paenibacillus sp. PvP091]MBP1168168.1 OFA family oxalate/formate antiporter-like MFS transporter [Paenibacillus sp. PvR098]MBP2439196.1 OFA family oxalate/formate antiporter-like MFS transporter [Paenibacillus sp. PvP052]